jgi:hypothetical protein
MPRTARTSVPAMRTQRTGTRSRSLQAGKYVGAVMSGLPKRNGWSIAQHVGDRTPDRTQRLLNRAAWDTFAAMGVVRRFAVSGLDEAARRGALRIGALDESGQEKKGEATAGVKRQHMGCAGGVENGINTVHLSYIRERTGHALIGARQWIPAGHIDDPVKSLVMGLPADLVFRTKGQLAIDVCADAFADGIWFDFMCGDEVYGSCTGLREFLEGHGQGYVLRVPSNFHLTLARGATVTCAEAVRVLLTGARRWEARSAGKGSKGERWYGWAWLGTASPRHHLLVRRHIKTGELAFHYCYVPEGQPAALPCWSAPPGCAGRWRKISSSARAVSGWMSPRSASTPRSPGTPCWSWPGRVDVCDPLQAGGDRSKHTRRVDGRGRQIGDVGQQDRAGNLDRRVVDPVAQPTADPSGGQADRCPGRRQVHDRACVAGSREVPGGGGGGVEGFHHRVRRSGGGEGGEQVRDRLLWSLSADGFRATIAWRPAWVFRAEGPARDEC